MRLLAYLIIMAGAWLLFAAAGLPQAAIPAPDGAGAMAAQATAARPLPLPTIPPVATAVAQLPTAVYQLPAHNPMPHVAIMNERQFNGRLLYCYLGDGWGGAERAAMGKAFQSWQGAGVAFDEVGDVASCDVQLFIAHDPESPYMGWATIGPGFGPTAPATLTMNTYYGFSSLVASHEIGHILGLNHAPAGVMADAPEGWPGPSDFGLVKQIWGLE